MSSRVQTDGDSFSEVWLWVGSLGNRKHKTRSEWMQQVSVWTLMAQRPDPSSLHLAAGGGVGTSSTENLGLLFCKSG